jgi:hypothetical protein
MKWLFHSKLKDTTSPFLPDAETEDYQFVFGTIGFTTARSGGRVRVLGQSALVLEL